MIIKNNLKILKDCNKQIYNKIKDRAEKRTYPKIILSELQDLKNFDIIIAFGINSVTKNLNKKQKIIIIEPSVQNFINYLYINDLKEVFEGNKVNIFLDESEEYILEFLNNYLKRNVNFTIVNRTNQDQKYFNYIETEIKKIITILGINISTTIKNLDSWNINTLKNIKKNQFFNVNDILSFFENKNIIIVGAGPSLDDDIHLLNDAKKKAIVVAVGTGIGILEKNNIKPHFRMAVDGSVEIKRYMDGLIDEVPFITSSRVNYDILKEYIGPKILISTTHDYLTNFFFQNSDINFTKFISGSSVSNIAVGMFCHANANRILLLGHDFCYKNSIYAKNSGEQESKAKSIIKTRKKIELLNCRNEKVYSDSVILSIKNSIESLIKNYKNVKVFMGSDKGLPVENTILISLKNFLTQLNNFKLDLPLNLKEINFESNNIRLLNQIEEILKVNNERLKAIYNNETDLKRFDLKLLHIPFYQLILKDMNFKFSSFKFHFNSRKVIFIMCLEIKKYCLLTKEILEEC